jgi:hypothetical protein
MEQYKNTDEDVLLVSFVGKYSNWATTAWIDLPYPKEASQTMNPWLQKQIEQRGKQRYGVLPMDFPPQALIETDQ